MKTNNGYKELEVLEEAKKNVLFRNLKNDFEYQPESVTIKTIFKSEKGSAALFLIDKEQGLIEHAAASDALVYILEGEIDFIVSGKKYNLKEGDVLGLPAKIPHSLAAVEKTKMLLTVFS